MSPTRQNAVSTTDAKKASRRGKHRAPAQGGVRRPGNVANSRGSVQRNTKSERLFPWYIWVIALVFGWLAWLIADAVGSPDDLAAWWIGARLVDQGEAHVLYSINPQDFGIYADPEWAREAAIIGDTTTYPRPYVHLPLVAYVMAPLTNIMTFATFAAVFAFVQGVSFVLLAAGAISLWTRKAANPGVVIGGSLSFSGLLQGFKDAAVPPRSGRHAARPSVTRASSRSGTRAKAPVPRG